MISHATKAVASCRYLDISTILMEAVPPYCSTSYIQIQNPAVVHSLRLVEGVPYELPMLYAHSK